MASRTQMLGVSIVLAVVISACLFPVSVVAQTTHVVGGTMGWVIPSGDANAYNTWAATKKFSVGDKLVFNYAAGQHDVAHSSKAAYDACNASLPIISTTMAAPATITLTTAGENYFFCTIGRHCAFGQKLAINVSTAVSSPSPMAAPAPAPRINSPTPVPISAPVPSPPSKVGAPVPSTNSPSPVSDAPTPGPSSTRVPMTYTVGDSLGWTVPSNGETAYTTWASNKDFMIGDTLVFTFAAGRHDVAEIAKTDYQTCSSSNTISKQTTSPARVTLTSAGEHYYICTFTSHCSMGQKLAINVTASGVGSPAPSSIATPLRPNFSPSPTDSTTPSDNNGNFAPSNTAISGLSATLLSIIVAYMLSF